MASLEEMRKEIDSIDRELVVLFEKRMDVSKRIGDYKSECGLPIYDENREREVLESRLELLSDKSLEPLLRCFYSELFRISREHQKR